MHALHCVASGLIHSHFEIENNYTYTQIEMFTDVSYLIKHFKINQLKKLYAYINYY
jgi:hypothetical protein